MRNYISPDGRWQASGGEKHDKSIGGEWVGGQKTKKGTRQHLRREAEGEPRCAVGQGGTVEGYGTKAILNEGEGYVGTH